MSRGECPICIGLHGAEDECEVYDWRRECPEIADGIESAATRKGTHVRLVSKYKEKKYKPRRVP